MMLKYFLVLALLASKEAMSKRILISPCQITSHFFEASSLVTGLIQNGHEVYILAQQDFPKLHAISDDVKQIYFKAAPGVKNTEEITAKVFEKSRKEIGMEMTTSMVGDCEMVLQDTELLQRLKELNFDLALADGHIITFCPLLIPYVLKVPFVFWFSAIHPTVMRVPALPSFFKSAISPHLFTDRMTFSERLTNLLTFITMETINPLPGQNDLSLLQQYAPEVSDWNNLARKAVLFIETRDHLLEWPMPSMPNVIRTPGITGHPPKELSQEFAKIIDNAADGFILVSFGSMATTVPEHKAKILIEVFNQIDIPIIWRFSGRLFETAKGMVNNNVHLFKWIPQNDLLGQANVKLFVTHCGNNGQYEALYHGVPMVGIPMFAEQSHNALRIMDHGFGVSLLPGGLMTMEFDHLLTAITEVLQNQSYKMAIMKRSEILKDNPMSPTETVTYWIEHVMEFGGDHLRSHAMDMPWYAYYMIDIFAFVAICTISSCYILVRCMSMLCCKRKMKTD